MNYVKAQQDLLKEMATHNDNILYGEYEEGKIAYSTNGYYAVIIPEDLLLVNLGKLEREPTTYFKEREICHRTDTKIFTHTGLRKQLGKAMAMEFQSKEGDKKWIDEKLFKVFADKKSVQRFYGKEKPQAPLFIEDELLGTVGFIMPMQDR